MSILLWLVVIPDLIPAVGELGYTLERYDGSTGIYFENKGQVHLYNTEWQVIVYINLKEISSQSNEIEQYIKHIDKLCQELVVQNWTDCYHFSEISRNKLQQVKRTENLITDISDHKLNKIRKRRDVFNFIGEISKILFGTMDKDDAKYYNAQIKHFEENSDDITKLLKQHLVVVKSTLGAISNTLTDMEYNQKKVENSLIQVKNFLDSVMADNQKKLNVLAAKIMVESHIARSREALDTLQRHLDIVLESIVDARKGILSPQIVSPKIIMDTLIQSMPSFPKDTLPTFPLSKDSINSLYKVCDIHVYIDEDILGYVITLPLIGRGVFKAYKMIPVPIALGNHKFAYVETGESDLYVDQTRQYYFENDEGKLNKCEVIDSQARICKQKRPLL
jgi:hypothetical protein